MESGSLSNEDKCNIYMDASGDSGLILDSGATQTFTVVVLVEHQIDRVHNRNLVLDAKKIVNRQPKQELKCLKSKKHPRFLEMLKKLGDLRADLLVFSIIKVDYLQKYADGLALNAGGQALGLTFALEHVMKVIGIQRAEIWADASNPVLEQVIKEYLQQAQSTESQERRSHKLAEVIDEPHFVSSNSEQMIQAADVFAGAMADFIEANNSDIHKICESCNALLQRVRLRRQCAKKKIVSRIQSVELLYATLPLFARNKQGWIVPEGFYINPGRDLWGFIDYISLVQK